MFKQKSFLQALYNVPMCTTIERHIHWQHTFQTACHIWQISQPKLMVNWLPNFYPSKKMASHYDSHIQSDKNARENIRIFEWNW